MHDAEVNVIDGRAAGLIAPARAPTRAHVKNAPAIRVEVAAAGRLAALGSDWLDLLGRAAAPNVFMDPALVRIAAAITPQRRVGALLAWTSVDGAEQLAGVLTFAVGRCRKALPTRVLMVPPCANSSLATPVIDRACLDQVLHAMLDAVAGDPDLPNIVAFEAIGMDGPTMAALARVCAARGSKPCLLERARRPMLVSTLDGKGYLEQALSSSTRKKLRQHRRRLGERGTLTSVATVEPAALRRSLEEFLLLEASGWKGRQGTALLCNDGEAAFARAFVAALAEQGRAAIHALYLDGRPVSMQIVMRAGPAAFTWKTAYDEQFQEFSPGMLLLEDYTAAFLADAGIASVDSCAYDESGFMAAWTERQTVGDIWIDARPGASRAFAVLAGLQKGYRRARATAKASYLAMRRRRR